MAGILIDKDYCFLQASSKTSIKVKFLKDASIVLGHNPLLPMRLETYGKVKRRDYGLYDLLIEAKEGSDMTLKAEPKFYTGVINPKSTVRCSALRRFLVESAYCPNLSFDYDFNSLRLYSSAVKDTAQNIRSGMPGAERKNPCSIISAILTYLDKNIKYMRLEDFAERVLGFRPRWKSTEVPALYALVEKSTQNAESVLLNNEAKCTGFSSAYIALARTLGVPSRMVDGYVRYVNNEGPHRWAASYVRPYGWLEIDPVSCRFLDFNHSKYYYKVFTLHSGILPTVTLEET